MSLSMTFISFWAKTRALTPSLGMLPWLCFPVMWTSNQRVPRWPMQTLSTSRHSVMTQ